MLEERNNLETLGNWAQMINVLDAEMWTLTGFCSLGDCTNAAVVVFTDRTHALRCLCVPHAKVFRKMVLEHRRREIIERTF